MKLLVKTVLVVALFGGIGIANQLKPLELGFADCHTVRASKVESGPQEYISGIVIRLVSKDGTRESFAVPNKEGYVSVPLRPGSYCFEAYDRKGSPLELDSEQERCFEIKAKDNLYLGVVWRRSSGGAILVTSTFT